jgi:hypothetical protein
MNFDFNKNLEMNQADFLDKKNRRGGQSRDSAGKFALLKEQ